MSNSNEVIKSSIPAFRLEDLRAAINKVNRRLLNRGMPRFELLVGDSSVQTIRFQDGQKINVDYIDIELSGHLPMMPGYKFVGMRTHDSDGIPIFIGTLPPEYRELENPSCYLCNTKRNRKDYALVEHKGELQIIGKTCYKHCFGEVTPEMLIMRHSALQLVTDELGFDEYESAMGSGRAAYGVERYLSIVVHLCKEFGFVPANDEGYPTWLEARDKHIEGKILPTNEDKALALEIIQYFKALPSGCSEYEANVRARLELRTVGEPALKFIASAWYAYRRAMQKKTESESGRIQSDYVGTLKQRLNVTLKLISKKFFDDQFGGKTYYHFEDESGNRLRWKTSSYLKGRYEVTETCPEDGPYTVDEQYRSEEGDIIDVKLTIGKHHMAHTPGSREECKITDIQRPVVLSFSRGDASYQMI